MGHTIHVVGNCQADVIATALQLICPSVRTQVIRIGNPKAATLDPHSTVFLQHGWPHLANKYPEAHLFPRVAFFGFHPDAIVLNDPDISSPLRHFHSAIALAGFLSGRTAEQTIDLFNGATFAALGYYAAWEGSRNWFLKSVRATKRPLERAFFNWPARGCFMHLPNHPKVHVCADIALALAVRAGLPRRQIDPTQHLQDRHMLGGVWPVYPEIAEFLGIGRGDYIFRGVSSQRSTDAAPIHDLAEFVRASFEVYANAPREKLQSPRFADGSILNRLAAKAPRRTNKATPANPYAGLPDHQFWRKAISNIAMSSVDPVIDPKFKFGKADKIATAGSCFAQHISAELVRQNATYLVAEPAPSAMSAETAREHNYGIFSARYGNLYTAGQAVQLFDRAFGYFTPELPSWIRKDGRFVDPFRPQISLDGFESECAVLEDRERHLSSVRRMFTGLDVLIFTLGLTEAWRARSDGSILPTAPGVVGGAMDEDHYEFVNFTFNEVVADLRGLLERLKSVNPKARLLLTVSPVPLVATYEKRHVLVSTMASKSILRAAAETLSRLPEVSYFPSYELITGHYNRGAYFADDLREVSPAGVRHVMSVFCRHFLGQSASSADVISARSAINGLAHEEADRTAAIVCDEEILDRS